MARALQKNLQNTYKFLNYNKVFYNGKPQIYYSGSGKIGENTDYSLPVFPKRNKDMEGRKSKQSLYSGQPTPTTHPHLLKSGEITSGITRNEYMNRRHHLMDLLSKTFPKSKHHILIIIGNPRRYMIDKIPYLFRQDTDFLYLTGCLEPDCVLVIHSIPLASLGSKYHSLMFTQPYDPSKELWDGPLTTPVGAPYVWGMDQGLPIAELPRYLTSIEKELENPCIWYNLAAPTNAELHLPINDWIVKGKHHFIQSPKSCVQSLRSIKSPSEMTLMREACRISGEAIRDTMKSCCAPVAEHHLFATVDYQCRMRGAEHLAYPPVIAGGPRSTIIHYINNNNIIKPGEMVLMDAGCEYRGYSGDITRTWPVNGKFSSPQRDLYEGVLEVQNYVIDRCSELTSLNQLFSLMCTKLGAVLQELCIIPKDLPGSQVSRAAFGFCPHHVSHYLGMDVHDCPLVSRNKPLSPGIALTIEPGVYISERNSAVDRRYLGLGIRIEDDILINETGKVEVLSKSCPKNPDELELVIGSNVVPYEYN